MFKATLKKIIATNIGRIFKWKTVPHNKMIVVIPVFNVKKTANRLTNR